MNKKLIVTAIASMAISGMAFADTSFGSFPTANFGGTGNPTDPVLVTTLAGINGDTITLGLAAQQRYDNPALTSPSTGVYLAGPGSNVKGPSAILGALWNFDFYANVVGNTDHPGDNVSGYTFKLYYDFDPAAGTAKSSLGVLNLNNGNIAQGGSATTQTIQDSQNLDFGFLGTSIAGIVTPPSGSFDPNATGEYTFILEVDNDGHELGEETILVDVANAPDVSATLPLFGMALSGLAMFAKRKNRA
jgi:hypothetical protein